MVFYVVGILLVFYVVGILLYVLILDGFSMISAFLSTFACDFGCNSKIIVEIS